jgi:hypothetical protein
VIDSATDDNGITFHISFKFPNGHLRASREEIIALLRDGLKYDLSEAQCYLEQVGTTMEFDITEEEP